MTPYRISTSRLPLPEAFRVVLLMTVAAMGLAWLIGHTEILFPDGLRYVEQARKFDQGAWTDAVRKAVDHPLYPLAIVATRRVFGLAATPDGRQLAAQIASAISGVLLVIPLYLVARELFGKGAAWLGVLLVFLVPLPAHVFADTLSESTLLLFWTWGVWASLRFLRAGELRMLLASLGFGGLAYLSRPEGLLLPPALIATLILSTLIGSARLPARRWWVSMAVLVLCPLILVGPYVVAKGGLGTKPAVARLLGIAPPSKPDAVERERPLDVNLGVVATYRMASGAVITAVCGAISFPLVPFSAIGFVAAFRRRTGEQSRAWLFLGVVFAASMLALVRLYATGGYCTPRHTFLISLTMLSAAGAGIRSLTAVIHSMSRAFCVIPGGRGSRRAESTLGSPGGSLSRNRAGASSVSPPLTPPSQGGERDRDHSSAVHKSRQQYIWGLLLCLIAWNIPALIAPVNFGAGAYRQAGLWVAKNVPPDEKIVDVTGWSQFYSERPGYSFANLIEAPGDPQARWIIVRDAHIYGPWGYCERLRAMINDSKLVIRFPAERVPGRSRVSIYERPGAITKAESKRGTVR